MVIDSDLKTHGGHESQTDEAEGTVVLQHDVSDPPITSAISLINGGANSLESSIRSCISDYKEKGQEAAIERAFHELDTKENGQLDHDEITAFMEQAAKLIKLDVASTVISDAVEALMEDVGAIDSHITKEQFQELFEKYPDLLRCFDDEVSIAARKRTVMSRIKSNEELDLGLQENEQVWSHAHTAWKSQKVSYVWTLLYLLGNIAAFTYKAIVYSNRNDATDVFGQCILVARGSAQCLNLNCCLVLLPVCRHFLTQLRHIDSLKFVFPFDAVLEYHVVIGMAIALFATLHVSAHICDFYRFARSDEDEIITLVGDKLGDIPDGITERWLLLLRQPAGITGIIMVVCLLVAYPLTQYRRKHFNSFWISHHLLLVMLVALCFHGIGNLLEPFQSVYWVMVPLTLYFLPRAWRETPLAECEIIDVSIKKGNVVCLQLARPKSWDKYVKSGMYAFINIPAVSRLEWHPFTLTSSPADDFIEFHFSRIGDWTGAVHDLLEDMCDKDEEVSDKNADFKGLVVKVEGPMGASSQGFGDYPIVVLIGAGIGVTPMMSVLKQLLQNPGKMKRTFLYWTVRDRAAFEWFSQTMDEIFESDNKHMIQIRHFLTSVKDDDRDIGAVLLHHATRAKHHKTNFDLILGQYTHHQVEVGRPDWEEEFESVKVTAKELGCKDCGIFLCGPERMADDVANVSFRLSKKDPGFHFYFTKETF
jgi:respiratory burst oxidase